MARSVAASPSFARWSRWAIAAVARSVYGERYVSSPMRHRIAGPVSEGGRLQVQYGFRTAAGWSDLYIECEGKPARPAPGSLEQFITEHYWGYAMQPRGGSVEYRVEHEPWRVWRAVQSRFEGECASLYGDSFAAYLHAQPDS